MANLDTRSKRASSVAILLPFLASPVLPDATLSQGDRQHIAFSYSGILASGGPPVSSADGRDHMTLGTVASFSISPDPALGGRGST